jgi:hypothetical protein
MSASTAGTGVRRLVHYSSRPLEEWGKIPKFGEWNDRLRATQHRTAFITGKPRGIWYAYEEEWHAHYGSAIEKRKNMSEKNKEEQFQYKYLFEVPESRFTTELEPDDSKILVLTLENFKDFLIKYNAPGVFPDRPFERSRTIKPLKDWLSVWEGFPKEFTFDGKPYFGLNEYFAGVEFSVDLVEYKPENGFKVIESEKNKTGTPKIIYEFDLANDDGTVRHVVADVSFLRHLEVRSGCIFTPQKLFHNPPAHYLVSGPTAAAGAAGKARRGGRRTRRGRKLTVGRTRVSSRRNGL